MLPLISFLFSFFSDLFYMSGNIQPPNNQKGPPLWWKIVNLFRLLILIAQIKRLATLNATQKNGSPLKSTVFEKTQINCQKIAIFKEKCMFVQFLTVFLDYFRNGALQRAADFLRVKSYPTWKKRFKKSPPQKKKEKKSNQRAKWNKKMGGRSFVIPYRAFEDNLLQVWSVCTATPVPCWTKWSQRLPSAPFSR